jgi:hypothetical protein
MEIVYNVVLFCAGGVREQIEAAAHAINEQIRRSQHPCEHLQPPNDSGSFRWRVDWPLRLLCIW